MSRDKMLLAIREALPKEATAIPDYQPSATSFDVVQKFIDTLVGIGGAVIKVSSLSVVNDYVIKHFSGQRVVSLVQGVDSYATTLEADPHLLENVALTVVPGAFGVAENGAVWITDGSMGDRALPFIANNLAMIISAQDIVPTLHEAYQRIGADGYNFGTFIAGPSKTADIEQSLVLGAHGPKSNTIFLLA
ncbi:LutC/YkgG family protein [Pseudochryseolinea flava]|uniref:Lactate utilization protein B/C n=1 Tax=Pseudochryseolinea flava TaxID=2059302 RepID=A0A364XYC3_9BACT|nr:LUD domain-containing protein [Pseudochryseolinea flava]RAV99257.1 lactate utilization protein B/C [Pseudochryseolinea flava]